MLGIKLTDGLYDESNKPYFISRSADAKLKTNLVRNTFEEMTAIQKLCNKAGLINPKIILVTSACHMTRSKNLFEKKGSICLTFSKFFTPTSRQQISNK